MVDLRLLNSSGAFRRDLECHWAGPVRGREACPERGARCATVVHVGPVAHAWPTHPPTQKLHPHFLHPQIGEGRCCDTLDKKCTRDLGYRFQVTGYRLFSLIFIDFH